LQAVWPKTACQAEIAAASYEKRGVVQAMAVQKPALPGHDVE
jgi:hypothetical protein